MLAFKLYNANNAIHHAKLALKEDLITVNLALATSIYYWITQLILGVANPKCNDKYKVTKYMC